MVYLCLHYLKTLLRSVIFNANEIEVNRGYFSDYSTHTSISYHLEFVPYHLGKTLIGFWRSTELPCFIGLDFNACGLLLTSDFLLSLLT